jgi:hypothetical protein
VYAAAHMSSARKTSVLLFFLFQSLYALTSSGNAFRIPDEFEVYFQAEHLVDAGDLSVPQTLAIQQPVVVNGRVVGTQSVFFGKYGQDGKPYAPYGPLSAVLAVPHHLLGRAVAAVAGVPRVTRAEGLAWVILVGGITLLSSATAAALAVAGFHRAALAISTPPSAALVLSLLLGGATVLWPYSATLYSEAWQAAALVWAAALLLEARAGQGRARPRVIGAALLLTVAGLTKVTALVFAPAFVVAVLFDRLLTERTRREVAVTLTIGIILATAIHFRWNEYRFDEPFDFGYDWSETIPVLPPRAFAPGDVPRGLAVLLLSPGKSLFVWAPVLVLAVAGARRLWQRERALAAGIATATGVGLVFFAAYQFPEGGYSHGPRNLVPILPLMLLPAAGAEAGQWRRPVLAACAAIGFIVALLALSVSYLEDQAMVASANGYYEQIEPAPGRPANRYRLGYIPFITTLRSPGWASSRSLGQGPDFFPLHLRQAQRQLPDGRTIPSWLIWGWPLAWLLLFMGAAIRLRRA